ncbi:MAG TPA: GlsB/YeaQ/YmgE family stress response membrane protein [Ktedonobacteraceae bacterium]|nr:GlsB/YeaQ/YmgE family stress response membrane protein [Ktedonobacteraceae bacterium]
MAVASLILADISLMAVVWWLIVGLIAGALASAVMRGGGYGIVGDIVVGLIGAFIGGFLASLLGVSSSNILVTILIAFIGACILIALLRLISGGTSRRTF